MKKWLSISVLAVLVVAIAVYLVACGGDPKSDGTPVTYTSTDQAASSASEAGGAVVMVSSIAMDAFNLAGGNVSGTYAPRMRRATDTTKISNIDPKLQVMVDKMRAQFRTPVLKAAMKKAQALTTSSSLVQSITTTLTTGYCNSGSISITGTNNLNEGSRTYDESTVTVKYNMCRDNLSLTELTGKIEVLDRVSTDMSDRTLHMKTTGFQLATYTTTSFTVKTASFVMDGTFNNDWTVTFAPSLSEGTYTANGSYVWTLYYSGAPALITNYSFSNVNAVWAQSTALDEATINGSFSLNEIDPSTNETLFSLGVSLSNLSDNYEYLSDTAGTEHEWLNGSITISWYPGEFCTSGKITFTTPVDKPMTYTNADYWYCPISGTLSVNNATIVFGSPIQVTVNGVTAYYTNCDALANASGGLCGY